MAVVLPKKTRKVTVRKNRAKASEKESPDLFCVICGNTKVEQLGRMVRPADGPIDSEPVKVVICARVSTCAGLVSLMGKASK